MREKGYSFGKIAKILGLSKQTVYNRYNNWLLQEERKKVKNLGEEYTRKLEELERKEMELQEREKILEYREKIIEEREWEIEQKLAYLDSLKFEIEYLEKRIRRKENEIQELTREKLRLMDEIRERRAVLNQLSDLDQINRMLRCCELDFGRESSTLNFEVGKEQIENKERDWEMYHSFEDFDLNFENGENGDDIFDKLLKDWTSID